MAVIGGIVALAAVSAGCGSSGSDTTAGSAATAASTAPSGTTTTAATSGSGKAALASNCGPISTQAPADPDGMLGAFDAGVKEQFGGYPETVHKSVWTDWKPSHAAPYKVGVLWAQLSNPVQSEGFKQAQAAAKAVPGVEEVVPLVTSSGKLTDQIQQYNSLVRQKVDVIILQPLSPGAFAQPIAAAAKAGIPTITIAGGAVDSANAINLNQNFYRDSQVMASRLVNNMGGKGNVLIVRGVPGFSQDTISGRAYEDMLKSCSDVTVAGKVVGMYTPSVAKAEVLKFLATHPGKIDGVAQAGTMAPGIIEAFEQAGRPVPPVMEPLPAGGTLVYWKDHLPDYHGLAVGYPQTTPIIQDTLARMFDGNGPKISEILIPTVGVDDGNLDQFIKPGWTDKTEDVAVVPDALVPKSSSFDAYFANGDQGVAAGQ
ncbi:hypothetical protein DSM104329_00892 [Capillimicrobium parvum]|uniref:Periplasmic binding protein domain-containing protein n=2 Tax=Capillimicrobium parvum TaxID=2884022 RepID=A0A9E7BZF4_9ACTN|nr:hypothetical protein DSM104329_00892 [Capillimicrobium parvum]